MKMNKNILDKKILKLMNQIALGLKAILMNQLERIKWMMKMMKKTLVQILPCYTIPNYLGNGLQWSPGANERTAIVCKSTEQASS